MESTLPMSPPWISFYRKLEELFGYDPEITLEANFDGEPTVIFYVNNATKADALEAILPSSKSFGNVTLTLIVKPSNDDAGPIDKFRKAFSGNPILNDIIDSTENDVLFGATYVEFINETVQYFDDRLDDPNGNVTTVYEDLARDVFEDCPTGIFFCTAAAD